MGETSGKLSVVWKISKVVDSWVFGLFQLCIDGIYIGEDDESTALNVVFGWVEEFLNKDLVYDSSKFNQMTKEDIVAHLYDPYMVKRIFPERENNRVMEKIPENYVSYLGDSSFDRWVLLVINQVSHQRIVWVNTEDKIVKESYLPSFCLQDSLKAAASDYYAFISK